MKPSPAEFTAFYRRHASRVRAEARHRLRFAGSAQVEDVVQMVFLHCFEKFEDLQHRRSIRRWLKVVVSFAAAKVLGRSKTRLLRVPSALVRVEDGWEDRLHQVADPGDSPEEQAMLSEGGRRMKAFLEQLAPEKRAVLELHDLQGLDGIDIARRLVVPVATVRTRLFYARRDLERIAATQGISFTAPIRTRPRACA